MEGLGNLISTHKELEIWTIASISCDMQKPCWTMSSWQIGSSANVWSTVFYQFSLYWMQIICCIFWASVRQLKVISSMWVWNLSYYVQTLVALSCPSKLVWRHGFKSIKGRTIRKLMRGAGEVQKKIFAQGKIKWKKIHARQLTLKNVHAMA